MTELNFEPLEAVITEKVNSTTGHESFGWGTKVELQRRELGSYTVNKFFKREDKKENGSIQVKFSIDIEKMKQYIVWHEKNLGTKGKKDES